MNNLLEYLKAQGVVKAVVAKGKVTDEKKNPSNYVLGMKEGYKSRTETPDLFVQLPVSLNDTQRGTPIAELGVWEAPDGTLYATTSRVVEVVEL